MTIKKLLIPTLAASMILFISCEKEPASFSDDRNTEDHKEGTEEKKDQDPTKNEYQPTAEDLAVDRTLFELMNLNYEPLAATKMLYEEKHYKEASDSLLSYFKHRKEPVNSEVAYDLKNMNDTEWGIANQALPEGGYRFSVHFGQQYEKLENGVYTYWSFNDGTGNINWETSPVSMGREFYQKHMHAWFTQLARAYAISKDEKYFRAWKNQYSDWMEKYPCPTTGKVVYGTTPEGYGWQSWHQNSIAARLTSQPTLFEYFISCPSFDFAWLTKFLASVYEGIEFSRSNLFPTPNTNYRFSQYKGHCKVALMFPEFKKAPEWLRENATDLSDYAKLTLNEDGPLNELCPGYHIGEVGGYRIIYNDARINGKLGYFPSDYLSRIRNAADFSTDYYYPDYSWECFNDAQQTDKPNTLKFLRYFSEMYPDDQKMLYLSTEGKSGKAPDQSLFEYRYSGYYMLRAGWKQDSAMLLYKNNYNPENFTHCHFDNGTVAICVKGRRFLPDPGNFTYGDKLGGELDAQSQYHRETSSHNTITKSYGKIANGFAKGKYLGSSSSAEIDWVSAENQSYADLTHRRTVWMVEKSFFVIVDNAFGSASGTVVNLNWHLCRDAGSLGKDVVVYDEGTSSGWAGAHTVFPDGNNILLRSFTTSEFSTETGESYTSDIVNVRYPRKFIRLNARKTNGSSTIRFITVLLPCSDATKESVSAEFTDGGFSQTGESLKVTVNGKEYKLSYKI